MHRNREDNVAGMSIIWHVNQTVVATVSELVLSYLMLYCTAVLLSQLNKTFF